MHHFALPRSLLLSTQPSDDPLDALRSFLEELWGRLRQEPPRERQEDPAASGPLEQEDARPGRGDAPVDQEGGGGDRGDPPLEDRPTGPLPQQERPPREEPDSPRGEPRQERRPTPPYEQAERGPTREAPEAGRTPPRGGGGGDGGSGGDDRGGDDGGGGDFRGRYDGGGLPPVGDLGEREPALIEIDLTHVDPSPDPFDMPDVDKLLGAAGVDLPPDLVTLDPRFRPIKMPRPPEGIDVPTAIVRGWVLAESFGPLRDVPGVVEVWADSSIAAHGCGCGCGSYAHPWPGHGWGWSSVDCQSRVPKGTVADVARAIGVERVWREGYTGRQVVIGIVDGGILATRRSDPEINPLEVNVPRVPWVTYGFPGNWGTTAKDWNWHGHMTALDAVGMAPDARVWDLRVSDPDPQKGLTGGCDSYVISRATTAYLWAIAMHRRYGVPDILSNSWGLPWECGETYATDPDFPFTRMVELAIAEGILVLFSAGNCGAYCPVSTCHCGDIGPGRSIWGANGHWDVMTVGAANIYGQMAGYSSQGPSALVEAKNLDTRKPDFCAPTHFTGHLYSDGGTSASCAVAAGVVALLKEAAIQLNVAFDQAEALRILKRTAVDLWCPGGDDFSGAGMIDACAALAELRS